MRARGIPSRLSASGPERLATAELLSGLSALPTTTTTAFKIGDHQSDPIAMYLADIFTVHANLAGIPAISIPNGKDAQGLSIGLQLMGREFEEAKLLVANTAVKV